MLDEIGSYENLLEWQAFELLEPWGWQSWAIFFGQTLSGIWAIGAWIAKIPDRKIQPWDYYFKPPFGFVNETEEQQELRLASYEIPAEMLVSMSDEQLEEAAKRRALEAGKEW